MIDASFHFKHDRKGTQLCNILLDLAFEFLFALPELFVYRQKLNTTRDAWYFSAYSHLLFELFVVDIFND